NIVVAGRFEGSSSFGGTTLNSVGGSSDIFLAKYSPSGVHLWSRGYGGTGEEQPRALSVDGAGTIAVAGSYLGTANVCGGTLANAGANDVFVAKYDSAGGYLWGRPFGGTGDDLATGVGLDASGNVIAAGFFHSRITFDGTILTASSGGD